MLSNETVRKLREMHLGVMAEAFSAQLKDTQFQAVAFEDRFAMLVDAEWSARKSNRLVRLIRNASYADPAACVENIEYLPERRLDREQILRLASCAYLHEAHNVIILGATGAGKTYLACALGMAASRSFYTVRYIRLPDLLVEISAARANGTYRDYMKKLKKEKLLILDEWLLYPLRRQRQGMCWNWWRPETRYPPLSSAPSMTPVSGMRTCTIPPWPMPSVIGSSTTHTQSKLRASPCASARPSPSKLRHGGSVHHASGRHAPFHRNGCTIRAEPVHHLLRSYCTLGAVYALLCHIEEREALPNRHDQDEP